MDTTNRFGLTWDEIEAVKFLVEQAISNHMPMDYIFPQGGRTTAEAQWLYQEITGHPFVFGIKPSPPDPRDKKVGSMPPPKVSEVDFRPLCSPVENQQTLGACGPNAEVGCNEYLQIKTTHKYVDMSRLFEYWNARNEMGTVDEDSGVYLRALMKGIQKYGHCPESLWPYDISRFKEKPPDICYEEGQKDRISEFLFLRPGDIDHARQLLAVGYPIVACMYCYSGLFGEDIRRTNILPMPLDGEKTQGGHAIAIMGFSDSRQSFLVRNSWGPAFCMNGYFWMPYKYYNLNTFDAVVVEKA